MVTRTGSCAGTYFALARASGALDDMAKIGRSEFTERCWERLFQ